MFGCDEGKLYLHIDSLLLAGQLRSQLAHFHEQPYRHCLAHPHSAIELPVSENYYAAHTGALLWMETSKPSGDCNESSVTNTAVAASCQCVCN